MSEEIRTQAVAFARAGRVSEALALMEATGAPVDADDAEMVARLRLAAGRIAGALEAAREAVRLAPARADVRYTLGRCLREAGDAGAALAAYDTAITLDPRLVVAWLSRGVVLRSLGQNQAAADAYRHALTLEPNNATARWNLDLLTGGPQAMAAKIEAQLARAEALAEDAPGEALKLLLALPEGVRSVPALDYAAARLFDRLGQLEKGLEYYSRVLAADPGHYAAAERAGRSAASIGLVEQARDYLARAQSLRADPRLEFKRRLLLPAITTSRAHIATLRRDYESELDALEPPAQPWTQIDGAAWVPTFYLAYHGEPNAILQAKLAKAYLAACPSLATVAPHCTGRARPRGRRLRIGLLSAFFGDHSIGKTSVGLFEQLPRDRFEVLALALPFPGRGALGERIRRAADAWIPLEADVASARARIAALELDVLFYQDIGMDAVSYFLSFARLAPVQCVSFGHPDTTGVTALDYFVSNDRYEGADSGEHYTERLVQLHDLPTLAYYDRPVAPSFGLDRAALGIGADSHIYLCPQTLFKLHPDIDELFAGILRRDPKGIICLIDTYCRHWVQTLRERFAAAMPDVAERVRVLPRLSSSAFLDLLALADVVLDTPHFNGMNSSLETFAVGTPVVTLPTALQRGRHTAAMYTAMDLADHVTSTPADYVQRAVTLATDEEARSGARRLIAQRSPRLFQDRRVIDEFSRFFEEAYAAAQAGSTL